MILDNRENIPTQAYSTETATIMNRLLHYNMQYTNFSHTAAGLAAIDGWDIIGKTGTTDKDKDHWFIGMSPYAIMGTWVGFDQPASITGSDSKHVAELTFHALMSQYLKDKNPKEYTLAPDVEAIPYCHDTGLLATSGCGNTYMGYYTEDNRPDYCYGGHSYYDYSGGNSDGYDDDYTSSYEPPASSDTPSDITSEPVPSDEPSSSEAPPDSTPDSGDSGGESGGGDSGGGDIPVDNPAG